MERPRLLRSWRVTCAAVCCGILLLLAGCGSGNLVSTSQAPPLHAVEISMSPTSGTVPVNGLMQFTATVSNTSDIGVSWLVNGIVGGNLTWGTISTEGLYTAPQYSPPACPPDCPAGVASLPAGAVL